MSQKRLLVIEDDADLGEMLVTFFDSQGYEVYHATSGSEGVSLARAKFPNLILLDVMLPDMEGFDVCRFLRGSTLTKYIPITFLTQRDARADKVAGLQIGADDYVTKPFDIEELRLRVERSIKRATRDHIHEARTGLPTGPLVESEYYQISEEKNWNYIIVKVEGYAAFRDQYGFIAADDAIYLASNIISDTLARLGTGNDFLGIQENDFVLFTRSEHFSDMVKSFTEAFKERARTFYNFADVERGRLLLNTGTDRESSAPLMHFAVQEYRLEQA
ncbi:MAG: response regulator transcription factor [Chloroflexi bacterium]|nr:response regulator transcription factor [Chloroflexota bacterium]